MLLADVAPSAFRMAEQIGRISVLSFCMRSYCPIFLIAAAVLKCGQAGAANDRQPKSCFYADHRALECGQAGAANDRQPKSCSLADLKAAQVLNEPCSLHSAKVGKSIVLTFSFRNGTKVNVEEIDRQGAFGVWKINGSMGMGFEIDREHFTGSTMDLKQSMEWSFN